MKRVVRIISDILFIIAGVLILIFNRVLSDDNAFRINIFVGTIIIIFILFSFFSSFIKNEKESLKSKFIFFIVEIIFALTLIFYPTDSQARIIVTCAIWSVWSCERECREISEKIKEFSSSPVFSLLNFAESICVIIFCILLLINPSQHHIHTHVIICGIEFILEPLWIHAAYLEEKMFKNRDKKS